MTYRLQYSPEAQQDLERLDPRSRKRVWAHLQALVDDPRPLGSAGLRGPLTGYTKLRVGDYRIVYVVEDETVFVARIGRRSTIYKELGRL